MAIIDRFLQSQSIRWAVLMAASLGLSADLFGQAIPESRASVRTTSGPRLVVKQTASRRLSNQLRSANLRPSAIQGRLPNPVRQADHSEPLYEPPQIDPSPVSDWTTNQVDNGANSSVHESSWGLGSGPSAIALPYQPPKHAHKILRAPSNLSQSQRSSGHHKSHADDLHKRWVHPPYSSHHRRMQPEPPMLPDGKERETWKSPYSYGYFGASGTRHWSLHYGYRDRYTEWRLK